MTPIEIRIIDLDFPVGSKNKTATLITGEREAMLVDAASRAPTAIVWWPRCWTQARR
jgi:hypothetical protein